MFLLSLRARAATKDTEEGGRKATAAANDAEEGGRSDAASQRTGATCGTEAEESAEGGGRGGRGSLRWWCWLCRWVLCAALLAVQMGVGLFPYLIPESDRFEHYLEYEAPYSDDAWIIDNWSRVKYGAWMRQSAAMLAFVFFMVFNCLRLSGPGNMEHSVVTTEASRYVLLMWVANVIQAARLTVLWYLPCAKCVIICNTQFKDVVIYLSNIQYMLTSNYFCYVCAHRVIFLEAGWGASLGSRWLGISRGVGLLSQFLLFTLGSAKFQAASGGTFWAIVNAMQAWTPLCAACITWRALTLVRRPTLSHVPRARGIAQAEQRWARKQLTVMRAGLVAPLTVNALGFLVKAVVFNVPVVFDELSMLLDALACMLSLIAESTCLLLVLGVFREQRPDIQTEAREDVPIVAPQRPSATDAWTAKVSELAARGITAAALLDFYKRLGPSGGTMPHFSPQHSTTHDVVRQAIIPLSRMGDRGVAYADLVRTEGQGPPARMVTHTWACPFAVLVAGVVADAMGQEESGGILGALEAGRAEELRDQLAASGSLARSYWVCAFCVNQHVGICSGFGPSPIEDSDAYRQWDAGRRDVVTGQIHPTCPCGEPKYFNDSPDECEMNKFDDMMAELSGRVQGFWQLVVVDPSFGIFSRAWCVAELVQASISGIPQNVMLLSRRGIDLYSDDMTLYRKLATLTVTACKASRKEDKEAILSGIVDVQSFDARLQELIFGDSGLMRKTFVGFGLSDAAVRTARRLSSLSQASGSLGSFRA